MESILVLDPGESTGWCFRNREGYVIGGTCGKDHEEVAQLIVAHQPDLLVFERFNLYPSMARTLAWNTFYPCEVIGVIRYMCDTHNIKYLEQAPSVKKYSGVTKQSDLWRNFKARIPEVSEHTFDTLQHLAYYERNTEKRATL